MTPLADIAIISPFILTKYRHFIVGPVSKDLHTIDVERFTGLNICGFSSMKFFTKMLSRCIGLQCYYLPIAKNSQETFAVSSKLWIPQNFSPANLFPFTVFLQCKSPLSIPQLVIWWRGLYIACMYVHCNVTFSV